MQMQIECACLILNKKQLRTVLISYFPANLSQAKVIWEDRISTDKMFPLDWSVGKSVEKFSYFMIYVGGPPSLGTVSPFISSPGLYKKTDQTSCGELGSKQYMFMSSASVFTSRSLLCALALIFSHNGL